MLTIKNVISTKIEECAAAAFPGSSLAASDIFAMLEYPPDATKGDLALPCFKLSRTLRRPPVQIASTLAGALKAGEPGSPVASVEAVNGYLNFRISDDYLANRVLPEILEKREKYGAPQGYEGMTIVLDYSSPNVAKPFHIGHLGTTVIGHSIRRLFEFAGCKCISINHLGDWGTQFGKMIVAFRLWGSREEIEEKEIDGLVALYVKFHEEAEKDPRLEDMAREEFRKLEAGDPGNLALWRWFVEISLREYERTYQQLGIKFDSYTGESFYFDKTQPLIEDLKNKGLLKLDEGASIVDLEPYGMPPCLILKRDGSTIYSTRDIAAAIYRKEKYDFDRCIYVTSAGQSLHFRQWFKVIELMGYDWADRLVHVPYGTVSINGEKLATRTGNVILLKDLFALAIEKVKAIMEEKSPDIENREKAAEAVGVGAVVFYYLSSSRMRDINFVLEDALSFDGNTGPYVQYTYARTCSVLDKAGKVDNCNFVISAPEESEVLKVLCRFGECTETALRDYEPFYVTRFILDLAAAFNRFYHNCRILNEEDPAKRTTRIRLTEAVNIVLGRAFELICLKKMRKI
ncbi:MAG: arginine--tRNA ligase [Eubacteriales bacterium]|jgi:arginyl-tRNA synthetase